jgi:peroxiredoxin
MQSFTLPALFTLAATLAIAQGTRGAARSAAGALDDAPQSTSDQIKQGHSHFGKAYDSGPRTKPYRMTGIGMAHFPITHKNPEVQIWFDQGNTLLHHFWDYEAERAFRWARKLEPENAMVYWGLARAAGGDRSKEFIREAAKRKDTVTPRERLYIEALEAQIKTDSLRDRKSNYENQQREYLDILETIAVRYPDDLEAKALIALAGMGDNRYGTEQIIREILAKQADHPGAHHYRIHNWNYHEAEQALVSCRQYGGIAPDSGHAQHMPGHVYATVGMWHEAAISMDAATRVERKNMQERMTFPFNHWNYGHNRAYLAYIQEQLGMEKAAVFGAQQLMDAPLDPKQNADSPYSSHSQGISSMLRALVKFERWDALLDRDTIRWREIFMDRMNRAYARSRARLGLGQTDAAEIAIEEHSDLKGDLEKNKQFGDVYAIQSLELRGRLELLQGKSLEGLRLLSEAAEKQFQNQKQDNDPPKYPELLYNALGREYLKAGSPALAAQSFEKSLTLARNDIFALTGLVEARHALGQNDRATAAMASLLFTASEADAGLPLIAKARAIGVAAEPKDSSPGPQRNYARVTLDHYGPPSWAPFPAPRLDAVDTAGKRASLDEYKGRNVMLIFYLGRECLHCMAQLKQIAEKSSDWAGLDTDVVAASPNLAEETRDALKTAKLEGIRFLSDPKRENARRFTAYDDFEDLELHATVLIDAQGRVHWASIGGEPFTDMAFLAKQLGRMRGGKP